MWNIEDELVGGSSIIVLLMDLKFRQPDATTVLVALLLISGGMCLDIVAHGRYCLIQAQIPLTS